MIELCYTPYSVACFAVGQEMGIKEQMKFLEIVYEREYGFPHPAYRGYKKEFISDVLYWTDYLPDKLKPGEEFPAIEGDFKAAGRAFLQEGVTSGYPKLDRFFMSLRLRELYASDRGHVRMKLRALLDNYGDKRRSETIASRIRDCLMFYHIQPYLENGQECDIRKIDLDDMVIFRVM